MRNRFNRTINALFVELNVLGPVSRSRPEAICMKSRLFETLATVINSSSEFRPFGYQALERTHWSDSLVHALDQISHTVRELDYFSLSLDIEIDREVARGGAVDRLL